MSDRKAVIKNADMSEEMQQDAVDCATQALEKYNIEKVSRPYLAFSLVFVYYGQEKNKKTAFLHNCPPVHKYNRKKSISTIENVSVTFRMELNLHSLRGLVTFLVSKYILFLHETNFVSQGRYAF